MMPSPTHWCKISFFVQKFNFDKNLLQYWIWIFPPKMDYWEFDFLNQNCVFATVCCRVCSLATAIVVGDFMTTIFFFKWSVRNRFLFAFFFSKWWWWLCTTIVSWNTILHPSSVLLRKKRRNVYSRQARNMSLSIVPHSKSCMKNVLFILFSEKRKRRLQKVKYSQSIWCPKKLSNLLWNEYLNPCWTLTSPIKIRLHL